MPQPPDEKRAGHCGLSVLGRSSLNLGDRERIAVTGVDGYIQKPTDRETFVGRMGRLLLERLARRQAMREAR